MENQSLFRIGSRLAIVGGILAVFANVFHPRTLPLPSRDAYLREIADYGPWVIDHIGIFVGLVLISGSLVAFSRSLSGRGAAWGRLGAAFTVASVALVGVLVATDGIAEKVLALTYVAAPATEKAAALQVADALTAVNWAFFSIIILLYFGTTYIVFGMAVLADGTYAPWFGLWPLVAGLGSIPVGLVQALNGPSTGTFGAFTVFSIAITIWVLVMGVKLGRRAGARS